MIIHSKYHWRAEPWIDNAGKITESFDIFQGSEQIAADLCEEEAKEIVEAHNKAIEELLKEAVEVIDTLERVR